MQCLNCDQPLEEVFEGSAKQFQFRNALDIQVHLGYDEFHDQELGQEGSPRGCFCLGCATALVEMFPGMKKLVKGKRDD